MSVHTEPETRPLTPPHCPTYGVEFSDTYIRSLLQIVFPSAAVISTERLPSDQSWNNKIYFATIVTGKVKRDIVCKAAGRFWGVDKVENEVACLSLLNTHCPGIPTPVVYAWSPDGSTYCRFDGEVTHWHAPIHVEPCLLGENNSGWILMSRLPGRSLDVEDLHGANMSAISAQLAQFVHDWRTKLPVRAEFGNLWLNPQHRDGKTTLSEPTIAGSLRWQRTAASTVTSKMEYHRKCIEDALGVFNTKPVYRSDHHAVTAQLVSGFVAVDFEKLSLFSGIAQSPRFTHKDFAPHNVLVSLTDSGALEVTGLLDVEFAGYFPDEDECADLVASPWEPGIWPQDFQDHFLRALSSCGSEVCPTSTTGLPCDRTFAPQRWREVLLLRALAENLAPWSLDEGRGEELAKELAAAADKVQAAVAQLRHLLENSVKLE